MAAPPTTKDGFFHELRRRRVLSVAGAYIAIAWLITEIAGFLLEQAEAPGWVLRLLAIVFVVGFPVSVVIAWVVQVQPGGKWKIDTSKGQHKVVIGAFALGIAATIGLSWLILPRIEDAPEFPDYNPLPNSVAIMPFLNPAATPNEVTIGTTLYIALTNGLNASRELTQVKLKMKEQPGDLAALGRRVRVMTLLAGHILRSAGSTRVEMSLLDVGTGKPRWTRRFDWDPTQIMEQGTDIANGVLQSLNLSAISTDRFAGTDNREAYDALLLGQRLAFLKFELEDLRNAIPQIQKAIDLDPDYVQAYLALANVIETYLRFAKLEDQERQALEERMETALETAQELAPDSADVISMLGRLETYRLNTEVANRAFERALELDPDHRPTLVRYAYNLALMSDSKDESEKGVRLYRRVMELDPLDANHRSDFAIALWTSGRKEEARAEMQTAIDIDPEFGQIYAYLAYWEREDGRLDQAMYYIRKPDTVDFEDGGMYAMAALFYAELGARQEALAWIDKALDVSPKWMFVWSVTPAILIAIGREDLVGKYAEMDTDMVPKSSPGGWLRCELLNDLRAGNTEQALQRFRKENPRFASQEDLAIDDSNYYGILSYAWLLTQTGHEVEARHILSRALEFLDRWCDGSKEEGFWDCNSRYIVHGLLRQREQTLAELRRVTVEDPTWVWPLKKFEDPGALDFLKDDPEFQRLMKIRADRYARQLRHIREMEKSGEITPAPWLAGATP